MGTRNITLSATIRDWATVTDTVYKFEFLRTTSSGDIDHNTRAFLIRDNDQIVLEYDLNSQSMLSCSFPRFKLKVFDPYHTGDGVVDEDAYVSLFYFITNPASIDYENLPVCKFYKDDVLINEYTVDIKTLQYADHILTFDLVINDDYKNYIFRSGSTPQNPLSLTEYVDPTYSLIDIIKKIFDLLTGSESIDYGLNDLDYLLHDVYDGLDDGTIDEILFDPSIISILYGSENPMPDYCQNLSQFIAFIRNQFQMKLAIDENNESHIYNKVNLLTPQVISYSDILDVKFHNFERIIGSYAHMNAWGYVGNDYTYYGDVEFDDDGNVSNSNLVNQFDLLLFHRKELFGEGDSRLWLEREVDELPVYVGFGYCKSYYKTGSYVSSTTIDFPSNYDYSAYLGRINSGVTIRLKGTKWNGINTTSFPFKWANGESVTMYFSPYRIKKNYFKYETTLQGHVFIP